MQMTDDVNYSTDSIRDAYVGLFRRFRPAQMKLREIARLLGETKGQTCLDVTSDNGMIGYHLRKLGGTWYSAVADPDMLDNFRLLVGDSARAFDRCVLPFDDKTFDAVVVVDFLESVEADGAFIAECHRVLKPAGRIIVNVPHLKTWTLLQPLEQLLGISPDKIGWVRAGYTESDLFTVLKDGFDVHLMRSYLRFWMRLIDALLLFAMGRMKIGKFDTSKRAMRLHGLGQFFFWLADQLDMFLFFTRGFYLVASAQRRAWRPRRAPILADGRSITEAVLSKVRD